MRSDTLIIDNREKSYQLALEQADAMADGFGLPKKDALHLRLLTEETMGLFRELTGEVMAKFWIEGEGKTFQIHLTVRTQMDAEKRSELLAVSSSGKNAAAKGFTGKLRNILEKALDAAYVVEDEDDDAQSALRPVGYSKGVAFARWSMQQFREESLTRAAEDEPEDWDELEKSIVGRLADDITIGIRGREVEMVITMIVK